MHKRTINNMLLNADEVSKPEKRYGSQQKNFPYFKPSEEIRDWDKQSIKPEMIELAM